jgi:hypothetical protein
MLVALLLLAGLADWVPARWQSADPESLAILNGTPINCVLLEQDSWSPEMAAKAAKGEIATLGVVHPDASTEAVERAKAIGLSGLVLEGRFEAAARDKIRKAAEGAGLGVVLLPERTSLELSSDEALLGTYQGVWPGIHLGEDGVAKAAPTGAPWIETNSGFLRFLRARAGKPVWMGVRPPEGEVVKVERYLQAVGDAAMVGARWIVALDSDRNERLMAGEEKALADWKRIATELEFWQEHRAGTLYEPCGQLALIQDVDSGGLLSNGIIDMLTARHTPLRTLPPPELTAQAIDGSSVALSIDPPALSDDQNTVLKDFARGGGMLLKAPPGWDIQQESGQVAVAEKDVEVLDDIWHGVNMTIGRENLGVRLFNVASMRSELVAAPDGEPAVLHLVNYSDYPVENITVRPRLDYAKATVYLPGEEPLDLEIFENGEIDIEVVTSSAILELRGAKGPASSDDGHRH